MTRKFFSGNNLEQVVMMAARHYEIEPDELAYRQIEKRHGFLRTRKAVMIAVDPEKPRREEQEAIRPETSAAPSPSSSPREHEPAARHEGAPETGEAPALDEGNDSWDRPAEVPDEPAVESPAEPSEGSLQAPADEPAAESRDEPSEDIWEVPVDEPVAESPAEPSEDGWEAPADEPVAESPAEPPAESWQAPAEEPATDEPQEPMAAAESSQAPAPGGERDEELLEAAEKAAAILMAFAGIDAEASASSGEERVEVEIDGPDATLLVVEEGKGLLAIQHLLPRMLRGLTGRSSFVRADSDGFHRKRKERLQTLALKEAEVASRTGRPRTLPPMAPDERRIVHLALQASPAVDTESRGTGLHKRVVIRPVAGDGGTDDIEARHGF